MHPFHLPRILLAVLLFPSLQSDSEARILSPASEQSVSGAVDIVGTASGPDFLSFRVEFAYEPNPTGTWFPIGEGTASVREDVLAVWDTVILREGSYTLRLTVLHGNGTSTTTEVTGIRVFRPANVVVEDFRESGAVDGGSHYGIVFPAPTAAIPPQVPSRSGFADSSWFPFLIGGSIPFIVLLVWQSAVIIAGWKRSRGIPHTGRIRTRDG
jgi:hypothetical protein